MTSNTFAERMAIFGMLLAYSILMGGMFVTFLVLLSERGPVIGTL